MNAIVWALEWRTALRRPRLAALNLGIPLLLVTPIALSDAPIAHAAAVYAVLFTLFGTFGSAIPLVRDAEIGILQRITLTGFPPRRLILERVAAQAALDTAQLLPALAVIVLAGRPTGPLAGTLPLVLAASLLCANALGCCIAAIARSIAEAALFAAVAALFALHAAGVFRTPDPSGIGGRLERLVPFRYLHEALLGAVGAPNPPAPTTLIVGATLGAATFLAVTALLAPPIAAGLARSRDR